MILKSSKGIFDISDNGIISFSLHGEGAWHSTGPLFLLHYYDRQHPRAQVVAVPSSAAYAYGTAGTASFGAKATLSLETKTPTELLATINFENIDIQMKLIIALNPDGGGFSVRIDEHAIEENMPELYRVLGIELLPEFGAAHTGEEGYLTLPNWSGCQTFFNKDYPREVRQSIYSRNDQWENACNMPLFGITRSQGTLCGIVTQGEFDAELICRVHWEKEHTNSVHPHLIYRCEQQDEIMEGCREVRYAFAPHNYDCGEGYVFCGKTYREFRRQERGLLSWSEKAQTRPAVIDYRDRFFMKIFMAYKTAQRDGHGPYHSVCTFAETKEILADCLSRGMKKLAVMLVGWGIDGHDGMCPARFPVDERLGGEKGFRELIEWCKENDILIGVHDSYGESYSCSPEFDIHDVIRHRTGEPWQGVIWSGGQAYKLCPAVYVEKHTKRDIPQIKALGIYGHHHIDAVGSYMTCFSKDHLLERRSDFAQKVREMFQYVATEMGSVSTEMPFGPYFDVVDGYFHSFTRLASRHMSTPIGQFFADRVVPLLQIVLHGSVNCCESIRDFEKSPLYWLEWGLCPQWEVCMSPSESFGIPAYAIWADRMAEVYNKYYGGDGLLQKLNPLTIEGRWDLAEGVTRTRYSDGTIVTVQAGNCEYQIERSTN